MFDERIFFLRTEKEIASSKWKLVIQYWLFSNFLFLVFATTCPDFSIRLAVINR